ncbi:MAG TPA: hypothetical protein PKJ95_08100, partial [Atribacterota bacterium]|nr:hypothetical protein [Atribacterota bacterium]
FNFLKGGKKNIYKDEIREYKNNILIFQKNGCLKQLSGHSLLSQKTFSNLISIINDPEYDGVYIPGIIQETILKKIADKYYQLFQGKTIIINNPTFLLIGSREINHLKDLIGDLLNKGINIKTLYNLPILAVTINPFYPKYDRLRKGSYEMASIDRLQLHEQMTGRVTFPVINIKEKESSKLLMEVKKFLKSGNR